MEKVCPIPEESVQSNSDDEEVLGSDNDEQEDRKDYCAGNTVYHHHHHHRFYVCFSTLAQVRRFPINSSPPCHPVLCIFFSQLKLFHIIHYTLVPCFSASASTFLTFYQHISACCNPIILVLTFNVPKPSQSTTPYYIQHT